MIYQISSDQGPAECELGVAKLLAHLQEQYSITVLDYSCGSRRGTYRSVRFLTSDDLRCYVGSIRWIWQSTYRPKHKRKNWFLDFSECQVADTERFDEKQIRFETFHSGGNGGQNVNKVETGVRAVYIPNGLSAVCTEQRSQLQNKQKAVARLREAICYANAGREAEAVSKVWRHHTQIVRGSAVRTYAGIEFLPV